MDGKSLFCIMTYVVMYESKLIWSLGRNEFYKMCVCVCVCVFSVYSVCIQCVFSVYSVWVSTVNPFFGIFLEMKNTHEWKKSKGKGRQVIAEIMAMGLSLS